MIAKMVVLVKADTGLTKFREFISVATYTVEALTTLISGVLVPVVDAIFLAILLYQFLSLGFGASPERLLPAIEKILFQKLYVDRTV